jgi:circadian clock protein KaiC
LDNAQTRQESQDPVQPDIDPSQQASETSTAAEAQRSRSRSQDSGSMLLQRVPSGIEGLDAILHGGFFRSGLYLIIGEPGTGKTVLSNQIAFNHVAQGGRVLFVSLLSESHARMFAQLSSLSFFDEGPIGDALYFISGYSVLQREGLTGLLSLLQGSIRDRQATMLVIDGILHAEPFASSSEALKEFVHSLHQFAEISGCTVLLLSTRGQSAHESSRVSLETIVDGVIDLCRERTGMHSVQELEVLKFRGGGHMRGGHTLEINADGVQVYPRTEVALAPSVAALQVARSVLASRERVAFGVERLDEMLLGGLLRGSSTVLLGPPGSGKTLLGLHFLAEGARQQEPGLYFGLNEPPPLVVDAADAIGLDFTGWVDDGRIEIFWQPALETSMDLLAQELLARVREHGVKRVFIDGLDAFEDISHTRGRLPLFLTALNNQLRALGVTSVTSIELDHLFGPTVNIPMEGVSAIVENIIFLRYVELQAHLYRIISILKMRRSRHDLAIREFTIGDTGLEVSDTLESAEAILTGLARALPANEERMRGTQRADDPTK